MIWIEDCDGDRWEPSEGNLWKCVHDSALAFRSPEEIGEDFGPISWRSDESELDEAFAKRRLDGDPVVDDEGRVTVANQNRIRIDPGHYTITKKSSELNEPSAMEKVVAGALGAQYETKDSGKREEYSTGMVRDTQDGKPRFDLLFPKDVPYQHQILTRFAQLMERGAQKYSERNWELAGTEEELERFKQSGMRHMVQWFNGETDEDHAAAVMFNLMAFETTSYKRERDGRANM